MLSSSNCNCVHKIKECDNPQAEVVMTKKFYNELIAHLNNKLIHLSETDRANVDKLDNVYDGTVYDIYDSTVIDIG